MMAHESRQMIGGGRRAIAGTTGRHLLAEMGSLGQTSGYWTQKERDAFVACGRRPQQPSLFDPALNTNGAS